MSIKSTFSEDEWKSLNATPALLGLAISAAGNSGIMGSIKESYASISTIMGGLTSFPGNELIQALAPGKQATEAKETAMFQRAIVKEMLAAHEVKTPEQIKDLAFNQIKSAVTVLDQKYVGQTADEYRAWLMQIATKVAEASKEGGFLGFGGTRVSEGEQICLNELKEMLGNNN